MAFRSSVSRTALFLLSIVFAPIFGAMVARAQDQAAAAPAVPAPPTEVEQALRERATQFLQYQVDGSFRKSFDLVAEESKDWYFASTKAKILSFKIESVEYSDGFAKATVKSSTKRTVQTLGQSFSLEIPMFDRWKIEEGKWVWYHDPATIDTPFGNIPAPSGGPETTASSPAALPADLSPAAVAAAAAKLTSGMLVNRKAITFVEGTASVEEIVFHNGAPGMVQLTVDKMIPMESISIDAANVQVKPNEDVRVKVSYTPDSIGAKYTTLRLTVQPFGRVYNIPVTLSGK